MLRNIFTVQNISLNRNSNPEVFLRKGVLELYSRFTGEHRYRSVISIKILCNFIEITLRHGWLLLTNLRNSNVILWSQHVSIIIILFQALNRIFPHSSTFLGSWWRTEKIFGRCYLLNIWGWFHYKSHFRSSPAMQLYWNHTWAWVFASKFAASFQSTFFKNTYGRMFPTLLAN